MIEKQIKIALALLASVAASISTFAADGTYDNTEAAEINANTTGVAANAGNIGTNTGNIATNTNNIQTNTGALATLNGNAQQAGSVANTVNTAVNALANGAVQTNTNNIATNTNNIATNTNNIATNTNNIATNTNNIQTNTNSLATLNGNAQQAGSVANALASANTYTDTREAAITTAYQSYADQAEADAITTSNTYTDTREAVIRSDLTANLNVEANARAAADAALGGRISNNRKDIDRNTQGIAMVAALTHTTVLPGMTHALDVSAAHFEGETGMALSYSRRINENVQLNFGGASTADFNDSVVRGGVGFQW